MTAHSQRFVRGLWTLDRELAYARHYPAVSWSTSFSRDADAVAAWRAGHGAIAWSAHRARMLRLLSEADRLTALADLIGIAGLAATERVTVLTARLLRDAVLRQSALSPRDGFCGPAKADAIVEAVLAVGDRLHDLAAAGHPAETLEAVDFGALVRARDLAAPDETGPVLAARNAVLNTLEEVR